LINKKNRSEKKHNIYYFNIFFLELRAQNFMSILLPIDVQVGKCYNRCLSLTEKWEWKEIDCKKKGIKACSFKERAQPIIDKKK